MNKYNNPRLLNTVVSGTGMKHPMQPHVVVGDTANGFIRGDLMDANAIVELVNNIIGGAPDTLDTLKEAADRIAALEHDTRDWLTQDDTLASKVDGLFKSLQILQYSEEDGDREDSGLIFKFFTERFDKHAENRYEEYFIPQATPTRNGVMSSAQAQALEQAIQDVEDLKNGPTLFAYEKVSGKFVIGYITNNTMFVHTDGDDLLVADADGVLSSLAYTTDDLKAIQSAVNEHFETSTFGITAIQSSFAIGDTIPNWYAYEKIEMPSNKIAVKLGETEGQTTFLIGTLSEDVFEVITNGGGSCVVFSNGIINNYGGPPASYPNLIKQRLELVGLTASTITENVVDWQEGASVPDWSKYTQYT